MAKEKSNQNLLDEKKPIFHWQFPETMAAKKKNYLTIVLILLAILVWAIIDKNFLFVVILVLTIFIIIFEHKQKPLMVDFYIFEDGLSFSNKFYPWEDIKSFRIVYQPPEVKKLYLDFKPVLTANVSISLEDEDPIKIRQFLKKYIPEDVTASYETLVDKVNRWLGF